MTNDAKEWVTVKVPREDKEKTDEYRPDGATFGDCLRAGAERLNEHLDSDPKIAVNSSELAEAVREVREATADELTPLDNVDEALAETGVSLTYDDAVAACRQAIREELPVEEMGR